MGTRTGQRGEAASSYSEAGLRDEIGRVELRLVVLTPSKASIRKRLESRLHNLERELERRIGNVDS